MAFEIIPRKTAGYLYCLYNPAFKSFGDNVYKLGRSGNLENRLASYTTYYVEPSRFIFTTNDYERKFKDCIKAERVMFYILRKYRVNNKREFFRCDIDLIKETFERLCRFSNKMIDAMYRGVMGRIVPVDIIERIERSNQVISDKDWFQFGYDDSTLKRNKNFILIQVTFKLKKASITDIAFAAGRSLEIIRHRKSRFPYEKTCGCFFKNFLPDEKELVFTNEGKKILAAGYYLDRLGIKGALKNGHSFVSSKHANMITHDGQGTACEIIEIARTMQAAVFKEFGLYLESECELIGFLKNPLYTREELVLL